MSHLVRIVTTVYSPDAPRPLLVAYELAQINLGLWFT
jgi:hypothetical protein